MKKKAAAQKVERHFIGERTPLARPRENTILAYDNKGEFTKWANRHGLRDRDYYFDCTTAVDARYSHQWSIPWVYANGTITWGTALKRMKRHFRIK